MARVNAACAAGSVAADPDTADNGTAAVSIGAAALSAFASPQLAIPAGTPVALQSHIVSATALSLPIADLAAPAASPALAESDAVPLPEAIPAADDPGVIELGPEAMMSVVADDTAAGGAPDWRKRMAAAKEKVGLAWAALPEIFPGAFLEGGQPVAFISSTYDTQVWVHRNEQLKQVCFAYLYA